MKPYWTLKLRRGRIFPKAQRLPLGAVALSLLVVAVATQAGQVSAADDGGSMGQAIPDLTLSTLDGATVRPADRKGRPLVLALVRQGQELSRRVLADLQEELAALQQGRIDVLAVVPAEDSSDKWRHYLAKEGIAIPMARDADGQLLAAIGAKALPATVIVDSQGHLASIIFLHRSDFGRDLWRRVRQAGVPGADEVRGQIQAAAVRQDAVRALLEQVRVQGLDQAKQAIAELRQRYPDQAPIRMLLGRLLTELGQPADGMIDLLAAQQLEPSSLRARLWQGIAQARSGHDDQAQRLLSEVADLLPDAWRAYGELASIRQRQGDGQEALRLWRLSVGHPKESFWNAGGAWEGTPAPVLAVRDMDGRPVQPTIVRSKPQPNLVLFWKTQDQASLACLNRLGAYQERFGDKQVAIWAVNVDRRWFDIADRAQVRSAVQSAEVTFPVWLDDNLESAARYDVATVPTAVLIDGRGVVTERVTGGNLSGLGDLLGTLAEIPADQTSDATSEVQEAADAAYPVSTAHRYLEMARHLARSGRVATALDSARLALDDLPPSAAASALMGRLLCAAGQCDEAAKLLDAASQTKNPPPGLLAARADCLVRLGLVDEARQWYHRCLEACPDYGPGLLGLGRILLSRGLAGQAVEKLRQAATLDPHDERALVLLAEALQAAGRDKEALQAYQKAYRARWAREGVLLAEY